MSLTIRIALVGGLMLASASCCALPQANVDPAIGSGVQHRCSVVAVASESPLLPVPVMRSYLEKNLSFQASKLVFANQSASADAVIELSKGGQNDTEIEVTNRNTGRHEAGTSIWTEYPGMIASTIVDLLRDVCPGSVVVVRPRVVNSVQCHAVSSDLHSLRTIAPCSRTSWMEDDDLYHALVAYPEMKRWGIQVLPSCGHADAIVNVSHNVDQTVEWSWTVHLSRRVLPGEHVVAFKRTKAAKLIADQLVNEIALARGERPTESRTLPASKAVAKVHSRLLSSDFSTPDDRVSLSIDSERLTAVNTAGRPVLSFLLDDLLDVRRRTEWDQPTQLPKPTILLDILNKAAERNAATDDDTGGEADATAKDEQLLTPDEVQNAFEALMYYGAVAAVFAQVRIPVHIVDLAWQENGEIKTASLQLSARQSARVFRALRHSSDNNHAEPFCATSSSVAEMTR